MSMANDLFGWVRGSGEGVRSVCAVPRLVRVSQLVYTDHYLFYSSNLVVCIKINIHLIH